MIRDESIKKNNRAALLLVLVALVLAVILMCLPAYNFNVSMYSRLVYDSSIGDAKYLEALDEVKAEQEKLLSEGIETVFFEVEKVKEGTTVNCVTFNLNREVKKSMMSFIGVGFTSSYVLLAILLLMVLGVALLFAGILGSADELWTRLDNRSRAFRDASCVAILLSALLVPVFYMTNTYTLSRQANLYYANLIDMDGASAFYEKANYFLLNGEAGNNIDSILKNMTFNSTILGWMVLPVLLIMLLGAIQVRYGALKKAIVKGLLYGFIAIVCIITLYPYYVMLVTGFRSPAETNDMYFLHMFPTKWIWTNFQDIVDRGVLRFLLNSLLISGGATAIALLCGIPAAYSMARMRYKGRKVFLGFVIMSQMFSPVVLLIGISMLMNTLGLNDNIVGLMLINAAFNQAFAIWLLRGTFISISPEMEKAGKIDGCTTLGSLWHILLPMAAPGIVTTLIFVFINAWNEYTISTVLISTATNKPITVGITTFSSFNMIEWQYLFAASLLATIPVVILFMCIEKHLADGLTSGGVKG